MPGKVPKPPRAATKPRPAPKAAKTARRAPPSKGTAASATSDWHARAQALAASLRIAPDELLARAVEAFAVAHGRAAAGVDATATVTTSAPPHARQETLPAPAPAAGPDATSDGPPALAPDVRLYVHGNGRPPQEMIRDRYVIGSSNRCDLWVNMPKVETKHLRITREGNRYFAEDLATEAGTVYDGRRLEGRHEIKHEDSLFLAGYHRVRFYLLS